MKPKNRSAEHNETTTNEVHATHQQEYLNSETYIESGCRMVTRAEVRAVCEDDPLYSAIVQTVLRRGIWRIRNPQEGESIYA